MRADKYKLFQLTGSTVEFDNVIFIKIFATLNKTAKLLKTFRSFFKNCPFCTEKRGKL